MPRVPVPCGMVGSFEEVESSGALRLRRILAYISIVTTSILHTSNDMAPYNDAISRRAGLKVMDEPRFELSLSRGIRYPDLDQL